MCSGTITVTNSIFSGNSATALGGAIYNGDILTVSGCTLTDNIASVAGGGIFSYRTVVYLANSTLGGNIPDNIVGGYIDQGGNNIY